MKTIQCDISEVTLRDDNVLFINIEVEKEFELKDFNQLKNAAIQLGHGDKFFNIINIGNLTSPNDESMDASSSIEESMYKYADAFVVDSLAQKLMGKIYMKYKKPSVPTKFFNSIEAAEQWIKEIKNSIYFDLLAYEMQY